MQNENTSQEIDMKMWDLPNTPWKFIKEGGKGVGCILGTFLVFTLMNTGLFAYAVYRGILGGLDSVSLLFVSLVGILGFLFTLFATFRTYQIILLNTMQKVYTRCAPLFKNVSMLIIDEIEEVRAVDISEERLSKVLNLGKILRNKYQGIPKFLQTGIVILLERIPFIGMIMDLQEDIIQGRKLEAGTQLYQKIDGFISEWCMERKTISWIWWLWLPLDIACMLSLAIFSMPSLA